MSNIPVSESNNWIFDGWATSSNTQSTTYTDRQSVSNLTTTNGATVNLYAVWHRNIPFKYYTNATETTATTAYKTQFYYNAVATSVSPSDLTLVTSTQSNSNWAPLGWVTTTSVTGSTTATLATNGSVTPAAGSAMPTYYALYSRTPSISYNANGGSGTTNATTCGVQKIAATGTASTSSCTLASNGFTAPTGYHFDKWRTGATSGSEYAAGATNYSFPNTAWASNMTGTLYAKWVGNTITLNWNENGGDAISDGSCTYGGNLTLPSAPTYTGYTFNGWKLANNTTQSAGATVTGGCTSTYTGVTSGTSTSIQAQWLP